LEKAVAEAVRLYIDAIPAQHSPLFDRLHRLILAEGGVRV
jgi:hypothetical protein